MGLPVPQVLGREVAAAGPFGQCCRCCDAIASATALGFVLACGRGHDTVSSFENGGNVLTLTKINVADLNAADFLLG